jgi:hypothetical protein
MNTDSNGTARYKVIAVETAKAELRRIHKERMQQGTGAAFLAVLRQVYDRLRKDPRGFGESLYRLPAAKLLIHQGILMPLVVTYGVHDELPQVMIRVVKLLSNPV